MTKNEEKLIRALNNCANFLERLEEIGVKIDFSMQRWLVECRHNALSTIKKVKDK